MSNWNWGKFAIFLILSQIAKFWMGDNYNPVFLIMLIILVAALIHGNLVADYQTYVVFAVILFGITFVSMSLALVLTELLTPF